LTDGQLKKPARFYRPELDAVRFLAFLLVFLHHTLPDGEDPRLVGLPAGPLRLLDGITKATGFGMSLFFALSAFLICELLLRERAASGGVSVKQFYIRRILRIWPLYYFGLALGVVAALLPGGRPSEIPAMGWFVVFMGAWQMAIHGALTNPMTPLWSLSVEEQFYLMAPWLVKYLTRRWITVFCFVVIVVSNLWLVHLSHMGVPGNRIWFDTFVQFECFAAGILLCLVLHGELPRIPMWTRPLLVVGALGLWFVSTYSLEIRYRTVGPGSLSLMAGYALAAVGTVMILVAFLGVPARWLPGWAIYLGRISFGLYVFHDFAIYELAYYLPGHRLTLAVPNHLLRMILSGGIDFVIAMIVTILAASLSYKYIETPFLKMKKRHAVIESEPIGASRMGDQEAEIPVKL
jgi:peptidoglycan/LPS O-acetylase OafA/YrhL